ncbi:MAG: hypothetical protein FWG98_15100 [Candidatus Cloacimonetes bacterium]|nr:hypothetical protein [Candidatus Cloacimonadota bacterium]
MKTSLLIKILVIMLSIFVGCTSHPIVESDIPIDEGTVWDKIYEKYYKLENVNVVVHIDFFSVSIFGNDNIDIQSCKLHIDDIEIELRNNVKNAFFTYHTLLPGEIYKIRVLVNGKSYQTSFKMPQRAAIELTYPEIGIENSYTFFWRLVQDYDAQYVGVVLERNDVDEIISGFTIEEINPVSRSFDINLDIIPINYTFTGVTVGGLVYVVNQDILFISQVDNYILFEEEK